MADSVNKKPTVHIHEDSGLKYLRGKEVILFENGVVVNHADFEKLKDDPGTINSLIDKHQATDPSMCGFDWPYACSTGTLRRKKGSADLVANARTERHRAKQAAQVTEIKAEEQKKEEVRQYVFSSVFLVTIVMVLVGIGSAVMSAYHTSVFLIHGGKPAWTSIMTGTMLILFSGTAFTAARYFFKEGKALNFFGMLFVVAGLAVISYSMFSTLTVNFNQFKWKDDEAAQVNISESQTLAAHRELIRQNEEALNEVVAEIIRFEAEADYWRENSWRRYDDINRQLAGLRIFRDNLRERGMELRGSLPGLVEVEAVSQDTIYAFLARLFHAREEVMRFFVYVIPACLYDILAPFALSVVLLLADRRKKEQ